MPGLKSMKRILVVDESRAVRETVTFVLGSDYDVVERPCLLDESVFAGNEKADLLILGISARLASDIPDLLRTTTQVPVPVLFLVDSRSTVNFSESRGEFNFLAKPFNPYALKEKVGQLLNQRDPSSVESSLPSMKRDEVGRYLDFPRIPAFTSVLAKKYALTSLPILIQGEMGCGQERVARAIYYLNDQAGTWTAVYISGISRYDLLQQLSRVFGTESEPSQRITLFLSGVEALDLLSQASLLEFVEREEERGKRFWLLSSSRVDLLEKVYRGEFLHSLYYCLATLTLGLPPLRERQGDIPLLVSLLGKEYGDRLGLGNVSFSSDAMDRLCNYLWFGNLDELEAVIARTLATCGKSVVQASDVVLGIPDESRESLSPKAREVAMFDEREAKETSSVSNKESSRVKQSSNGDYRGVRIFINELAHELKNPMVTIKTFAQLLGDRFDDAIFRARFRETVGGDIERMDDLLEALLDFSRFSHPTVEKIHLYRPLCGVVEEIGPECVKREATVRWVRRGERAEVCVDEAQLRYAFKNILQAALTQVSPKSDIEIDVEGEGRVGVAYVREADHISSFAHYLDLSSTAVAEEALPLRILLAKILLERNGGGLEVNHFDGGKVLIRTELPVP
jgi:DNA-binding NtrC family response regulator